MSSGTLVDLAWELGVTAASSDADQQGQTYVRICMQVQMSGKLETSFMELSLPQFYNFLHEIEKAHNQVKQYMVQQ